ncbi:MAG: helix-turn-helix domain-containing protein [Gallionellaceae bacterium]|nr:helix-turn-helix domain-containing protein [Gallionellaceae bacterium]
MPKTEKELHARDATRDIGAELLQSVRDLKAGRWARKTTFETLKDGRVRRLVELPDGTVEQDEILAGPRWELLAARMESGLSQAAFAQALGVSKRTLENWEQGRVEPTGPARMLLKLVARYPDTVERLEKLQPEKQAA